MTDAELRKARFMLQKLQHESLLASVEEAKAAIVKKTEAERLADEQRQKRYADAAQRLKDAATTRQVRRAQKELEAEQRKAARAEASKRPRYTPEEGAALAKIREEARLQSIAESKRQRKALNKERAAEIKAVRDAERATLAEQVERVMKALQSAPPRPAEVDERPVLNNPFAADYTDGLRRTSTPSIDWE